MSSNCTNKKRKHTFNLPTYKPNYFPMMHFPSTHILFDAGGFGLVSLFDGISIFVGYVEITSLTYQIVLVMAARGHEQSRR